MSRVVKQGVKKIITRITGFSFNINSLSEHSLWSSHFLTAYFGHGMIKVNVLALDQREC